MHLSVKLIFTLAGQMTTTGEKTRGSRMGRADWLSSVRHYEKHLSSFRLLRATQRGPVTGANGPRAKFTQTLHPHCQLGLAMPYSLASWHDSRLSLIIYTWK